MTRLTLSTELRDVQMTEIELTKRILDVVGCGSGDYFLIRTSVHRSLVFPVRLECLLTLRLSLISVAINWFLFPLNL